MSAEVTRVLLLFLSCTMLLAGCHPTSAQSYKVDWYAFDSGGQSVSGSGYRIDQSVGQSVAGFVSNSTYLHWIGFWAGEISQPVIVESLALAKMLPDGAYVSIPGRIATTSTADFADFFYIQEQDRSSGLGVLIVSPIPNFSRGSVVNVVGTLCSTPSGERYVTGSIVIVLENAVPVAVY